MIDTIRAILQIHVLWPLLILASGACLVYLVGRVAPKRNRLLSLLTACIYGMALAACLGLLKDLRANKIILWRVAGGDQIMLEAEPAGLLLSLISLSLGLIVSLYSGRYLALDRRYEYYYPLLLLLSVGLVGMVMSADLFGLYLFTILTSATGYVLVAFRRYTDTAIEAGFKYTIMGSMAAMLVLTGIGNVYRETGLLTLPQRAASTAPTYVIGLVLLLSGYAVKSALVPGHTWLPDAYGRAPSSISALLSGIVGHVNLYVLVKASLGVGWQPQNLGWVLVAFGVANMLVGNTLALHQEYGKRLLAYSSIAQIGYICLAWGLGLAYGRMELLVAGFLLLVGHAIMKSLAFLCKGALHFYCDATRVDELDGLFYRAPWAAGAFVVALIGLAGIPPLIGFLGKWQLVLGISHIGGSVAFVCIAVFVINALISLGYYLPLIGRLIRRSDAPAPRVKVSSWMLLPTTGLSLFLFAISIYPEPLLALTRAAAEYLHYWGQ